MTHEPPPGLAGGWTANVDTLSSLLQRSQRAFITWALPGSSQRSSKAFHRVSLCPSHLRGVPVLDLLQRSKMNIHRCIAYRLPTHAGALPGHPVLGGCHQCPGASRAGNEGLGVKRSDLKLLLHRLSPSEDGTSFHMECLLIEPAGGVG